MGGQAGGQAFQPTYKLLKLILHNRYFILYFLKMMLVVTKGKSMIMYRTATVGALSLVLLTGFVNADTVTPTQNLTAALLKKNISDWAEQSIPLLNQDERQLLANIFLFSYREALLTGAVQQYLHELCAQSYRSYTALNARQDATENLQALERDCQKLVPLQSKLINTMQARQRCDALCNALDPKEHSDYANALALLQSVGRGLADLVGKSLDTHRVELNKNTVVRTQELRGFLETVENFLGTIGINDDAIDNKEVVNVYKLRDAATQSIIQSWGLINLQLETIPLECAFVELSACIFNLGYNALYASLDADHRTLVEDIATDGTNELPNPSSAIA
jgi:hypothetical protein